MKEEKQKSFVKPLIIIACVVLCLAIAFGVVWYSVIVPYQMYNDTYKSATALMNDGKYIEAISVFEKTNGYKDSVKKIDKCNEAIMEDKYNEALAFKKEKKYTEAIKRFELLAEYKDSKSKIEECKLDIEYDEAIKLIESKKYVKAYEALLKLGNHNNSAKKAAEIFADYEVEKIKFANKGDYVTFGSYEQDNNYDNGREAIEWQVLDVIDGKMLLVSKYILAVDNFGYEAYWCDSDLRNWLNKDFCESAFTNGERNKISTTKIDDNVKIPDNTKQGKPTEDKLFVLSTKEANKYFASDELRECDLTKSAGQYWGKYYAKSGSYTWWLRTPGSNIASYGYTIYYSSHVNDDGRIFLTSGSGLGVCGVRPAMWIDLS